MSGKPSENSSEDTAGSPAVRVEEPSWSSKRHEIAYQEARAVLEAQQATAADIDQKTMRTARLTAILVGLVLSVAQLRVVTFAPLAVMISVGILILSVTIGIFNYSASDPIAGPNPYYLHRLVANEFPEMTWEEALLTEAGRWISDNEDEIARNGEVLLVQRLLLILGLQLLAVALSPGAVATAVILVGPFIALLFLHLTVGILGSGA